jgi:hypothetical protein
MGWAPAIASLVALLVAAILLMPCFLFFRCWRLRLLPGLGAFVLAIAAVNLGLVFTGWLLVGPGHPDSADWTNFVITNAIIASVGGIPGGLCGLVIGLLIERRIPPQQGGSPQNQASRTTMS